MNPIASSPRIDQLFGHGLPTVSFEFFPPKNDTGFAQLYQTIEELRPLQPSYVSVTYGAGGSTRQRTVELVERIQNELGIRSMAHLTCIGHTAEQIGQIVDSLWETGIRNVLALRGDPPAGQMQFPTTEGGFAHAAEMVSFLKSKRDMCLGVAGYPEGHPQCLNRQRDMEHLKEKVDNGAAFVVTQLFFDNADFYRFRDDARAMGIKVPIVAGIMPILNVSQIKRFVSMCGAKIPHRLLLKLEAAENRPEVMAQIGIDYAAMQCRDLLFNDVEGIHFYTLNRSKATTEICKGLGLPHTA